MRFLILFICGLMSTLANDSSKLLNDFSAGNTQFTADVYRELLKSNYGNFFVCPLSAEVVLALVHAGAKGQTAQELSSGLYLPQNPEDIKEIFTQLIATIHDNDHYDLSSANKLYVKDDFKISDSFNNTAVKVFNAEIQNIDFEQKDQAASEINKWVQDKTHDNIKNLINSDDLEPSTAAVLVNAMYFHGNWGRRFDDFKTSKRPFHTSSTDQSETDMMELIDGFNYYESPELNAKFLELPYLGGDISMTIILPNVIDGLGALETHIFDVFSAPQYKFELVKVVVPKFKVETTIRFKPILQALGIKAAFENDADFSGIGANQEPLKISKVVQKAYIEVDEKGTTAAASTLLSVYPKRGIISTVAPKEFLADHPFIFCLKYQKTILFIGRYVSGAN